MKLLAILLFAIIVQSCSERKPDVQKNGSHSEIAMDGNLYKNKEGFVPKKIFSMNFEVLEKNYLQHKNDTIYIINFWATWCKPCVKELPVFEQIASDYSDKKIKVVLVSLDFPDKIEDQVIPFIKKNNIQQEVVLLDDADANSWIPKVSPQWTGAIPATVIYKKNNRKFYEQTFTFEELENELKLFL